MLPFRKRVNSDVTEKKLIVTERDMLEVGQVVGQLQEVAKRLASATDQLIDVIGQGGGDVGSDTQSGGGGNGTGTSTK